MMVFGIVCTTVDSLIEEFLRQSDKKWMFAKDRGASNWLNCVSFRLLFGE